MKTKNIMKYNKMEKKIVTACFVWSKDIIKQNSSPPPTKKSIT